MLEIRRRRIVLHVLLMLFAVTVICIVGSKEVFASDITYSVEGGKLTEDVTLDNENVILEQDLDLNGHTLTINGNLIQKAGILDLNGNPGASGKLIVNGDYIMGTPVKDDTGQVTGYGYSDGVLVMNEDSDSVVVSGSFLTESMRGHSGNLTAGTMEIKGDFTQKQSNIFGNFNPTGSHKVILSGTEKQTVHFDNPGDSYINQLYITNSDGGIGFEPLAAKEVTGPEGKELELNSFTSIMPFKLQNDITLKLSGTDAEVGSDLDLNGYTLTINGNLIQKAGILDLNAKTDGNTRIGKLIVEGDYMIADPQKDETGHVTGYGNSDGVLVMNEDSDSVVVNGSFLTQSMQGHSGNLTAGTMEIKGDFTQKQSNIWGNFNPTGSHKVILSGTEKQTVHFDNPGDSYINQLYITNSDGGIGFEPLAAKEVTGPEGKELELNSFKSIMPFKLQNDITLKLTGTDAEVGSDLDLNGYTLTINGNLIQKAGILDLNAKTDGNTRIGKLIVEGDYMIADPQKDETGHVTGYGNSDGVLVMNEDSDSVVVNGSFLTQSMRGHSGSLTAGTMEIKGDFTQKQSNIFGNFNPTGSHKVILSGTEKQTVHFDNPGDSYINQLYITNSDGGIGFEPLAAKEVTGPEGKELELNSFTSIMPFKLQNDITLKLTGTDAEVGSDLDLNGYTLTVKGNLIQTAGSLDLNARTDGNARIGKLNVEGNYMIAVPQKDDTGQVTGYGNSEGTLVMNEDSDSVVVSGSFLTQSIRGHSGSLTAGTMEIKRDFTQKQSNIFANFNPTGSHKVILSGTEKQTVHFDNPGDSLFNILTVWNKSTDGVVFEPPGEWWRQRDDSEMDQQKPQILSIGPVSGTTLPANPTIYVLVKDNGKANVTAEYRSLDAADSTWTSLGTKEINVSNPIASFTWDTSGLTDGRFELKAYAVDESQNRSDEGLVTYTLNVEPPSPVIAALNPDGWRMNLAWTPSDASDLAGYRVYRALSPDGPFELVKETTATSWVDTMVRPGQSYTYKVEVVDIYRNASSSGTVTGEPLDRDDYAPTVNAGDDFIAAAGASVQFDGSRAQDNDAISRYEWTFGDGESSSEMSPTHVYEAAGTYTATLTVYDPAGNSASDSVVVTARDPQLIGNFQITVTDASGTPLSDATVMIQFPDGTVSSAVSDGQGKATVSADPGEYKIYAYKTDYKPLAETVTVTGGEAKEVVLSLQEGKLVVGNIEPHRMTIEEIQAAGIDVTNPDNQWLYQFEVHLAMNGTTVTSPQPYIWNPNVRSFMGDTQPLIIRDMEPGPGGGPSGYSLIVQPTVLSVGGNHPEVKPTVAYMVIPGEAKWLKEFFEIRLTMDNTADPEFVITDSKVKLDLPSGLSLAPMKDQQQQLEVDLGNIAGGESRDVKWTIRGDAKGEYMLGANFQGELQPFGSPVQATFPAAKPIKVWGDDALEMHIDAQEHADKGYPYHVRFGLKNVSDVPVYNASVQLKEGGVNYLYMPNDELLRSVTEIPAGETAWFDYTLISLVDGKLNLADSFVVKTGGNAEPQSFLEEHPVPENSPGVAPKLRYYMNADGQVEAQWDGVEGAAGYNLYAWMDSDTGSHFVKIYEAGSTETQAAVSVDAPPAAVVITVMEGDKEVLKHGIEVKPVEGVTLNVDQVTLDTVTNKTFALEAHVTPEDAPFKQVSWRSNNTQVATVDDNGVVTAVSPGQATITVTTVDGGFTDTAQVTVAEPEPVPDETKPEWPEGSKLTVSDVSPYTVKLAWTPATDNVEVTSYKIYMGDWLIDRVYTYMVNELSHVVISLDPDTTYTFRVTAVDREDNESEEALTAEVTTPKLADPEMGLFSGTVKGQDGQLIPGVTIRISSQDGASVVDSVYSNDGMFDFASLPVGTWKVTLEADGYAAFIDYMTLQHNGQHLVNDYTLNKIEQGDDEEPEWPVGSSLDVSSITSSSVQLSWNPATDHTAVTGYAIYLGSEMIDTVTGSVYSYTAMHLQPNTAYTFKVEASDASGNMTSDGPSATVKTKSEEPDLVGISFDASSYEVMAGQTLNTTLSAVYSDDSTQNVTSAASYSSEDPSIASVDSAGVISGVKAGTTSITAEYEGKTATVTVTVTAAPAGAVLEIGSDKEAVPFGESVHLTLSLKGANDLYGFRVPLNFDPQLFDFESAALNSDFGIAGSTAYLTHSVNNGTVTLVGVLLGREEGLSGDIALVDITLKAKQTAGSSSFSTSTASSISNSQSQRTVISTSASKSVDIGSPVTGVELNKASLILNLQTYPSEQLIATVLPENATNREVIWSSSNSAVAAVDNNGNVTAVSGGTAVIRVTTVDGGKWAEATVTVQVPVSGVTIQESLLVLDLVNQTTGQLTAVVHPSEADNKQVVWTSSDPAIADVDSNGRVTAYKVGKVTVTATTADGGLTASVPVYVAGIAELTLTPEKGIVAYGENANVTIGAVGAVNMSSFDLTVHYDPSLFLFDEQSGAQLDSQFGIAGTADATAELQVMDDGSGNLHITGRRIDSNTGVSGDIGLVRLTFKALNTQGSSSFVLKAGSSIRDTQDGIRMTSADVQDSIASATADLNGDAFIEIDDLVMLGKAFGKQSGQPGYTASLDINSDGQINVVDLVYVADQLLK